jgi:hypothetical protein
MTDMKRVYIAAPLAGDVAGNIEKVKEYARFAFECGVILGSPQSRKTLWGEEERRSKRLFAARRKRASEVRDDEIPHFYALILNDSAPAEREMGLKAGLSLIWAVDELWCFGETVTPGMKDELTLARQLGITVRYFRATQKQLGGHWFYENKKGF